MAEMRVSDKENNHLLEPFSEFKVEAAINLMKPDSAPGSDELPVCVNLKL